MQGLIELDLINPKKIPGGSKAKKGYKNSGVITVMSCAVDTPKGFIEYLHNGLNINFSVGIDFTGSNGDPSQPSSLHYMNPYVLSLSPPPLSLSLSRSPLSLSPALALALSPAPLSYPYW
jgi:hypothetical protein